MEKKCKSLDNNPHQSGKKIKVKTEGGCDSKGSMKGNKREKKKNNIEETMKSNNTTEDEDNTKIG